MEIVHVKGIANPSDSLSRLSISECENVLEITSSEKQEQKKEIDLVKEHWKMGHASAKAMEYCFKENGIKGLGKRFKMF